MPPKKQKGQKMALNEFFADTTSGSWADEMEELPTAPAARDPTMPRRGEPGYLDSMPDRSQRTFSGAPEPRADVPLPTAPPYTAFVGNLTYETEEGELRDFFGDLAPTSARLVKDPQGKSKGFGYVEFGDVEALKAALDRGGAQLAGRSVRINIADSQSAPRRDFLPSAADEASQWRRSGPLPTREAPAPRRGSSFASAGAGGDDRDWGAARGAKFTPSAQGAGGGFSRESSGYGRPREGFSEGVGGYGAREPREPREPSAADEAGQWRSARPLVAAQPAERPQGREAPPHRPAGPADSESTWARGTKVRSPASTPSTDSSPAMPASRQRLNLLPRSSVPTSPDADSGAAAAPSSKASPFGAARPVDSAARDAAAASKLASADEQRRAAEAKAAEERERREAERKARDERIKKERDEQRASAPKRVHPSRLAQADDAAPAAPAAPAKDEDGFEVAQAGRRKGAAAQAPVTLERPVQVKKDKGFSFSAAAGQMGGDDDVDEVAEGVKGVQV
ncbi:Eukaryotic translation initiation factor 4B [Cryptotrichosporon argae]